MKDWQTYLERTVLLNMHADTKDEANQEEISDDDNEIDDGCSPISATPLLSSQHITRSLTTTK